jgi:hypothetical protein
MTSEESIQVTYPIFIKKEALRIIALGEKIGSP